MKPNIMCPTNLDPKKSLIFHLITNTFELYSRPDDDCARRHRHPEDRGRTQQQELARRTRRGTEHHPRLHRGRQGRRKGQ